MAVCTWEDGSTYQSDVANLLLASRANAVVVSKASGKAKAKGKAKGQAKGKAEPAAKPPAAEESSEEEEPTETHEAHGPGAEDFEPETKEAKPRLMLL